MISLLKDNAILDELKYRRPLEVTKVFAFKEDCYFPICPRCDISMEREYQEYCDRCGQALSWKKFKYAEIVRAKTKARF